MINKLLNIKNVERQLFKRHFIRNVILELNFTNLSKEIILKEIEKIKNEFKNIGFSRFLDIKQLEFKMTSEDEIPEKVQNDETIGIVLFNDEFLIRIELLENKLIFSIFKYLNFDSFIKQVEKVLNLLKNIIPNLNEINNISLSKQNSIISTETKSFEDINNILNKTLLPALNSEVVPYDNFDFTRNEFAVIKNNYRCKVSANCQRTALDEFEINLNILVIDNKNTNIEDVSKNLKNINSFNFSVFNWATTDKFKKIINEEI